MSDFKQKQTAKSRNTLISANPVLGKLKKKQQNGELTASEESAGYSGISVKTIFFLLITAVGFVLYLFLCEGVFADGDALRIPLDDCTVTLGVAPLIVGIVALVLSIALPFVVIFLPATAAILGTIYCLCQGALLGLVTYVSNSFGDDISNLLILALVITIVLVLAMLAIYATGLYRPGKKFRTVLFALMFTMVGASLCMLIMSFIPATMGIVLYLSQNPVLSVVFAALGVVIATLFLLCDFECIRDTVDNKLPRKYEWWAAFGLAFTVIWLYFKVLDLLLSLKND